MSNQELLKENRSRGWVDASTAPLWARERILEIRQAVVEKRSIPAPSQTYIVEAEQRSAVARTALGFIKRVFPSNSREAIAKRNGLTMDQLLDAELRDQARRQAKELRIGTGAGPGDAGFGRGEDGGAVSAPDYQSFRCTAGSISSRPSEHRKMAAAHRCVRDKQKTADAYAWEDTAAQDHDDASEGDERAQVRCVQRCGKRYAK